MKPIFLSAVLLAPLAHAQATLSPAFSYQGEESTSAAGFYSVGWSLAEVGDLTGDGLQDFAVGAPAHRVDAQHQGRVFFFKGGPSSQLLGKLEGLARHTFGFSIAGLGDINGDGVPDFAMGSPAVEENGTNTHRGEVDFFRSDLSGRDAPSLLGVSYVAQRVMGARAPSDFGRSVVFVGTGQHLLFAAAPWFDTSTGAFLRAANGEQSHALEAHPLTQPGTNERAGYVSFPVGDLDGDGVTDVATGAPGETNPPDLSYKHPGRVYFWSGASGRLINVIEGGQSDTHLGFAVARIGDADGDGVDDLLLGAPYQSNGGAARAGAAYVVRGSKLLAAGDKGPSVFTLPKSGEASDWVVRSHHGTSVNTLMGFSVAALQQSRYAVAAPGAAGYAGVVTVYEVASGNATATAQGEPGSWSGYTLLAMPNPPELVVGSPLFSAPGLTFSGRIDLYEVPGWIKPCRLNACGGCSMLEAEPGSRCPGGGTWTCLADHTLTCAAQPPEVTSPQPPTPPMRHCSSADSQLMAFVAMALLTRGALKKRRSDRSAPASLGPGPDRQGSASNTSPSGKLDPTA